MLRSYRAASAGGHDLDDRLAELAARTAWCKRVEMAIR